MYRFNKRSIFSARFRVFRSPIETTTKLTNYQRCRADICANTTGQTVHAELLVSAPRYTPCLTRIFFSFFCFFLNKNRSPENVKHNTKIYCTIKRFDGGELYYVAYRGRRRRENRVAAARSGRCIARPSSAIVTGSINHRAHAADPKYEYNNVTRP